MSGLDSGTGWGGPPLDPARPLDGRATLAPDWRQGTRLRLRTAHEAPWPDPLRAGAGETLTADPGQRTRVAGWIWCVDGRGRGGWTPLAWLQACGENRHRLLRDYDAAELSLPAGAEARLERIESGFAFVRLERPDAAGRLAGWLPLEILEPA